MKVRSINTDRKFKVVISWFAVIFFSGIIYFTLPYGPILRENIYKSFPPKIISNAVWLYHWFKALQIRESVRGVGCGTRIYFSIYLVRIDIIQEQHLAHCFDLIQHSLIAIPVFILGHLYGPRHIGKGNFQRLQRTLTHLVTHRPVIPKQAGSRAWPYSDRRALV